MYKKNSGFTLAEVLIVVGIVAVLVAVAVPIFSKQLETSREATDLANCRSAFAELMSEYMTGNKNASISVECKPTVSGWNYESGIIGTEIGNGDSTIADKLYIIQGAVLGKRESWNMAASKVGDGAIVTLFINGDGKIAVSIDGDYTGAGAHALVTDTALTDDMRNSAKDIGGWISVVNFKYSDDSNDHEGVTPQIGVIYKFRTGGRDVFLQTDGEFWYKWIQSTGSSGNWVKITNNEDVIS